MNTITLLILLCLVNLVALQSNQILKEFDEVYVEDEPMQNYEPVSNRKGRLISPIFSLIKQTPAINYTPSNIRDIFEFLRYDYPTPKVTFKEYDFIVIGAGSTGSVIASRLSEIKNWTILLLEAGGPEMLLNDVPLLAASLQSTDYNWGFTKEPHPGQCLAMNNQRCAWPRGKAIGGSSSINYMIYTRGNKLDWDRIAEAGNPGWSYDDVLPYFLKSEHSNLRGLENSKFHRRGGLWNIEYANYRTPLVDAFMEAAKELGNEIVDYNQENKNGFGYIQTGTKNGRRQSASKVFLYPFRHRSNLHILPFSRVTKINIHKKKKTATSIEYVRNKLLYKVKARKEIILSAGVLLSPQLLMLSGIGPKDHLNELGIDVIKDLQVGQNMYDHPSFNGLAFLVNGSNLGITENRALTPRVLIDWLKYGNGLVTIVGGVEALGYLKTNVSDELTDHPDIELLFIAGNIAVDDSQSIRKGMNIADWFHREVYGDILGKESWSIFPILLHPKSKGYIKLKDKNPFHWPKFYYDYFSDERDLYALVEGIKYIIKLSKTQAFKKYGSILHDKRFPTCLQHEFGTDEYWMCAVKTLTTTIYHQMGTCKMGPSTDPEAVVDHELRVHGIKKLRVADASIFPISLGAHLNAPCIMIGEKISDILKNTWI